MRRSEEKMLVIPAIDLKDGQCVRLKQGRMEDSTVFSDDPVSMAGIWAAKGARRLHIVDLNGAFAGTPVNAEIVQAIAARYPDLPIQIGGGIRSLESIQFYLDAGVSYVIIGTAAVKDPEFVRAACVKFPGKIIVGIDAIDGMAILTQPHERSHDPSPQSDAQTGFCRGGMFNDCLACPAGVRWLPLPLHWRF